MYLCVICILNGELAARMQWHLMSALRAFSSGCSKNAVCIKRYRNRTNKLKIVDLEVKIQIQKYLDLICVKFQLIYIEYSRLIMKRTSYMYLILNWQEYNSLYDRFSVIAAKVFHDTRWDEKPLTIRRIQEQLEGSVERQTDRWTFKWIYR